MDERALLEAMRSIVREENEPLKEELQGIKGELQGVKGELQTLSDRVLKIEVTQENVIVPQIKALAEGHEEVVRKLQDLDPLTEKIEDIQNTVDVLKHIVVKK